MNLHVTPTQNLRPDDPKVLKVIIEEKNDIIKRLKQQQFLLKSSLLENSNVASQATQELFEVKENLKTARRDAERWKIEAFNSLQQTVGEEEVTASVWFKEQAEALAQTRREKEELIRLHKEEMKKQKQELMDSWVIQKEELAGRERERMEEGSRKEMEIVDALRKEIEVLKERLERKEESYVNPEFDTTHMLEQQLRMAEEHILQQAETIQRLDMEFKLEIDRRDGCRKCRKLNQ